MAGVVSRSRARLAVCGRWPGRAGDAPSMRLPAGLAVAAHLAGVAAITAIAVLTTLLALMVR